MKTYATSGNLFAVRLADNWSQFFISVNFYNCRVLLLPPQNGIQLLSSFHFFFSKLNCLMFVFSSKKVSKRDSSMAAFVTVHAGSFCGLQEMSFNISHFYLFVFLHCRHKMKYSCYQDSSVICLFALDWGRLRRGIQVELAGLRVQETFGASLTRFQRLHPRWVTITILPPLSFVVKSGVFLEKAYYELNHLIY